MRESRTYGSVRGARDETRVPTATTPTSVLGPLRQILWHSRMSASLIGHSGSSAFRLSATTGVDVARGARASLRNRHQGRSIMGFEDEVERSFGLPCHRRFEVY